MYKEIYILKLLDGFKSKIFDFSLGFCVCVLGWTSGSCRPAGVEEDRETASGRLRLSADRNGLLQDERGDASLLQISSRFLTHFCSCYTLLLKLLVDFNACNLPVHIIRSPQIPSIKSKPITCLQHRAKSIKSDRFKLIKSLR